jgi:hypothetical protein
MTMSDDFLSSLREEPRPEFAEGLERRLREIEEGETRQRRIRRRIAPALAGVGLVAAVTLAFTLPSVRAATREFLDLFRVKRFAAVPVDPDRLARLQQGGVDLKALVSEQIEVTEPASQPETVDSPAAAGALAGIAVQQPLVPPHGAALAEVRVDHPGAFRVRLDTAKLESLARTMGVEDVEIPAVWNGATIDVQTTPVVVMRYRRGEEDFVLVQSRSPEVKLPPDVDLAELGRLGLRMAGMSPEEARLFARAIDWRSTLLVPVPAQGANFREVEVGGQKGLMVSAYHRPKPAADGKQERGGWRSVLLWSSAGKIFALEGRGQGIEILEMAQSIR